MAKTIGLGLAVLLIGAIIGFNLHKLPYFAIPVYAGKGGENTPPLEITTDDYLEKLRNVRVRCKELDKKLGIERGEK